MPRRAPRAMTMGVCDPRASSRVSHTSIGLAVRSLIRWCREPAIALEPGVPPGTTDGRQLPDGSGHARSPHHVGVSRQPAQLPEVLPGRDLHPLCGVGGASADGHGVPCDPRSHGSAGRRPQERQACGTMPPEVLALSDGLAEAGMTQVAMERTGESWRPV
jgi:hypothetical protein